MKFRALLTIFLAQFLLFGCAAAVKRQGYSVVNSQIVADCKVLILGYEPFDPNRMELLGSIEMYDTGFSLYCDEEYVLRKMKEEACALGADIVNITDEKQPDFWSTCYRAKADFIRFKNREEAALIESDPHYDPVKVRERSQETWRRVQAAISAGIMGGTVGGSMTIPHK